MRRLLPFLVLLAGGCIAELPSDAPLTEGAYVLAGEAMLDTPAGPQPKRESLVLFVDDAGDPTHIRDRLTGDTFAITFAGELSSDLCTFEGCDLFVERSTGCAVYEYQDYFRPLGISDSGHAYTGTVRSCPTDEVFERRFEVRGALVDDLLMPDGRLSIEANYPLDMGVESWTMTLDGAPITGAERSDGGDTLRIGLGTIPIGSTFDFTYSGPHGFTPSHPTPFATTATLTDLSLATAPPEGALDVRGRPVVYEDGALVLRDEGYAPREPFATLIALGDPGTAAELVLDVEVQGRAGGNPEMQLLRGDGTGSPSALLWEGRVGVPEGTGEVYLLLFGRQDVPVPNDRADPLVFTLSGLSWE